MTAVKAIGREAIMRIVLEVLPASVQHRASPVDDGGSSACAVHESGGARPRLGPPPVRPARVTRMDPAITLAVAAAFRT
jgi:hypothetical protein